MLAPGDPAPWFIGPSAANPAYSFPTVAGRYVVLCFFGSAGDPAVQEMLTAFRARYDLFNGVRAAFLGVRNDRLDRELNRLHETLPGMRFLWDFADQPAIPYGLTRRGDAGEPAV
jgi:peroxiredoxin